MLNATPSKKEIILNALGATFHFVHPVISATSKSTSITVLANEIFLGVETNYHKNMSIALHAAIGGAALGGVAKLVEQHTKNHRLKKIAEAIELGSEGAITITTFASKFAFFMTTLILKDMHPERQEIIISDGATAAIFLTAATLGIMHVARLYQKQSHDSTINLVLKELEGKAFWKTIGKRVWSHLPRMLFDTLPSAMLAHSLVGSLEPPAFAATQNGGTLRYVSMIIFGLILPVINEFGSEKTLTRMEHTFELLCLTTLIIEAKNLFEQADELGVDDFIQASLYLSIALLMIQGIISVYHNCGTKIKSRCLGSENNPENLGLINAQSQSETTLSPARTRFNCFHRPRVITDTPTQPLLTPALAI